MDHKIRGLTAPAVCASHLLAISANACPSTHQFADRSLSLAQLASLDGSAHGEDRNDQNNSRHSLSFAPARYQFPSLEAAR
jgi:hypothetical protein